MKHLLLSQSILHLFPFIPSPTGLPGSKKLKGQICLYTVSKRPNLQKMEKGQRKAKNVL